jgi:1,4-dihydroxy-2-naphthoate octaprenyltransferase
VLVGTAVADVSGGARFAPALAALLGAFLIQIATNLANDLFDHEKGADTEERLGPTRAVAAGLLTKSQVRAGLQVTIAAAVATGVYLAYVGGPAIVVIGVLSILSGLAYTGGPFPLGYHGLGDVFVMVFFGLVAVCGTVFVQTHTVPALALLASVPVGAIATAILVVNNVRDLETDRKANKRTLVARFGARFGVGEYLALLALAYTTPLVVFAMFPRSTLSLLPLASAPVALRLARDVARTEGRALNGCLVRTAKLLLIFGVLFSAGILGMAH